MKFLPPLELDRNEYSRPVVVLRNLCQLLKVPVSQTALRELLFHPAYPSLSSLRHFLHHWGIETYAAQLDIEQLARLDFPVIAHTHKYGGQFVLIHHVEDGSITYHDAETGWHTEPLPQFNSVWSGVALLVEATQRAGDINYRENVQKEKQSLWQKRVGIPTLLVMICAAWISSGSVQIASIGAAFFLGMLVSAAIVFVELDHTLAHALCAAGDHFDCHSVFHSKAAKLFNTIKMSDVGMVWFIALTLAWCVGMISGAITSVLHVLSPLCLASLVYVPFSIIYQWRVVKKWCMLCLTVQGVLTITALLLWPYINEFDTATLKAVAVVVGSFILSIAGWLVIHPFLLSVYQQKVLNRDLKSFTLDVDLFRETWQKQSKIFSGSFDKEVKRPFAEAPGQLILVTNPLCESCAEAHKKIKTLSGRLGEKISVQYRFSVAAHDGSAEVIQHLFSLPQDQWEEALDQWFETRHYKTWARNYPATISAEAKELVAAHQAWCFNMDIRHTPSLFLNGRQMPLPYKMNDWAYHLSNFDFESEVLETYTGAYANHHA
jgi:uncharacterized membrane protein